MRTLTVVSIEIDDTNPNDYSLLYDIETTTGRLLPPAVKEVLLNKEINY